MEAPGQEQLARHEHVFVVMRVDRWNRSGVPPENAVRVTKVFWTLDEAEADVQRLNQLKGPKGCIYFWQVGRLQHRKSAPESEQINSDGQ